MPACLRASLPAASRKDSAKDGLRRKVSSHLIVRPEAVLSLSAFLPFFLPTLHYRGLVDLRRLGLDTVNRLFLIN
jgi:hypothetical protein